MDITHFLIFLIIGAMVGWLAGAIGTTGRNGVMGNSLIGMIGGAASGSLFSLPIIGGGLMVSMVSSAVGAGILLYGVGRFRFKNAKASSIYFKGDELWIRRKPLNRR
jgi:uncharacterized membrane protein YeaQ/YmgE (transglycosylase-associated protein family)